MKPSSARRRPLQIENLQSRQLLAADGVFYVKAADVFAALLSQSQVSQEIFLARGFQAVPASGMGHHGTGSMGHGSLADDINDRSYRVEDIGGFRFTFAPLGPSSNTSLQVVSVSPLGDSHGNGDSVATTGDWLGNRGDGPFDSQLNSNTQPLDRPGDNEAGDAKQTKPVDPSAAQASAWITDQQPSGTASELSARIDRAIADLLAEGSPADSQSAAILIDELGFNPWDNVSSGPSRRSLHASDEDFLAILDALDRYADRSDSRSDVNGDHRANHSRAITADERRIVDAAIQAWIVQNQDPAGQWSQLAREQLVSLAIDNARLPAGESWSHAWTMPLELAMATDTLAFIGDASSSASDAPEGLSRWEISVSMDSTAPVASAMGVAIAAAFYQRKQRQQRKRSQDLA